MADSPRAHKPALRTAATAVALIVGLALLLWGADTLSRTGAEALVARNVQGATGATTPPRVTAHGRFFLPQVIRGAYDEIDVTTTGLTSGPLRIDRVESRLSDVRVPFHDVLVQDVRRIGVGHSVEDVTLRYDDLNAYFAATGRPLTISRAADGLIELTGSTQVLNKRLSVRTEVQLTVTDAELRLTPQQIDTGGTVLGSAARALLVQRLTLSVPLGTLPFGHQLTEVTPGPEALQIRAEGSGIVVQP